MPPRAKTKAYESGMKVTYEPRSRTVIVAFRGRVQVLPGHFACENDALLAGESFCRLHGWRPDEGVASIRSAW